MVSQKIGNPGLRFHKNTLDGGETTWNEERVFLGYPNDAVCIDVFSNIFHACAQRTFCFAWCRDLMEVPLKPDTKTFFGKSFFSALYPVVGVLSLPER